jgi:hypothetical protein
MATIKRFFNPMFQRWEFETVPEVIPESTEQLEFRDCHVLEIHLNNNDGSNTHSVTIVDENGLSVVPTALPLGPKTEYIQEFTGRLCPGGVSWSSSDGVSIVGYMRWF